jgi:ectoine hydroxylase-related dioxygenase (phytanoyl-CoA dioxygenase family)
MATEISDRFQRDGYLVLEDFYSPSEVQEMLNAGRLLPSQAPKEDRCVFQTQQRNHQYFLESGDKIRYFFEKDAIGPNNELLVPEEFSLNKVGHALATDHSVFRKYTFDNRIRELCWQLGFQRPAIAQSMYMFKNPGLGGEVTSHQDSTYLYTDPNSCVGFWVALEDSTLENGCLKFIRASHKSGVHRRFIRNIDKESDELLIFDRPAPVYQSSNFTSCPVKKGTLVVIHGNVVHRSEQNKSEKSRHAYTFHCIETRGTRYSAENWLQPNEPFPILYER